MLTPSGYVPGMAAKGIATVAMAETPARGEPFGLALMDMRMPEIEEVAATRPVRESGIAPDALPVVTLDRAVLRWAVPPRDAAAPVLPPVGADRDLVAQFDARVHRLFALLDAAVEDRHAVEDLRTALHQVAGTAAFFGKGDFGTLAAKLDEQLGTPQVATAAFLITARADLRAAAGAA